MTVRALSLVVMIASQSIQADISVLDTESNHRLQNLVPLSELFDGTVPDFRSSAVEQNYMIEDIDLRHRDSRIKKQFGGTCTTFGLVAAIENVLENSVDLSERHFWSTYRKYSVATAIQSAKKNSITSEAYWPQSNRNPYRGYLKNLAGKLVTSQSLGSSVQQAIDKLQAGYPVYVGFSTPMDMVRCASKLSNTTEVSNGGHAVAIVGLRSDPSALGGGYFIIKNSWGPQCGESGYQYMPVGLCNRNDMYCLFWSIEAARRLN